ncbi:MULTISPECIES: hypothetical protein [unclassified Bradyrhizobium]|uniref:hypothetical protein n=1 Tax=unclassified Bradyrhizobium TaxID=2631580 RepID=UPI002478BFAC|nr:MULTISPECIES: hypothetical protein [unclassified Bradyrhizobium]WGR70495.1 hypothetical protein MTX24_34950 [Bradyrhizobium sp. ISRA426]WGR82551.1 hypothetical protein MTX21_20050 [Bradyrhizobium sp. ISRA430]WGR85738.1 hypothetical protein MTX25_34635 [Bradyrhizobium sp. ISRA432]
MTQPDPIAFINAVLRDPAPGDPATSRHFELLPAEIAFLEHAFNLDETGRAIYPELTYSAPKKSGKTAFAAILTLTATLLYGGRNAEAICCANDLEQSQSRVFSAIENIVQEWAFSFGSGRRGRMYRPESNRTSPRKVRRLCRTTNKPTPNS